MQETIDKSVASLLYVLLMVCVAANLNGQSFPSGSTGADGDLIVNTPGVTTFTAVPVGGGSIYNFKTIQIAAGSTLKLSGAVFPSPLYFLAQGAVTVAGTIDLSGQAGTEPSTPAQRTGPTVPGAGGYGGGSAAFAGNAALPGLGPAGGVVGACAQLPGGFTGNQFLVPLVGGSGGAGGSNSGGAGGGALLVASSVSISVTGTITASGGNSIYVGGSAYAGAGAGGGIRLVAPSITGTGTITAGGGTNGQCSGGPNGIVRLESFQNSFTGATTNTTVYLATPVNLFLPTSTAQPSIMVTSIGGVAVPPNPTGSFTVPDVVLNSSSPLTVNIQASNIPPGTIPTVYFSTENFPDQQKPANAGLAGTLASSTTTATITLNPGYSKGYLIAIWTQ